MVERRTAGGCSGVDGAGRSSGTKDELYSVTPGQGVRSW